MHGQAIFAHANLSGLRGGLKVSDDAQIPYDPYRRLEMMAEENQLLLHVLDRFSYGIALFSKGLRPIYCNSQMQAMLAGYKFATADDEDLLGAKITGFLESCVTSGASEAKGFVQEPETSRSMIMLPGTDDAPTYELSCTVVEAFGYLLTVKTMDKPRRASEPGLMEDGDNLTGLIGLNSFCQHLDQLFQNWKYGQVAALHCLDLDHFAEVNAKFGSAAGDTLLKTIAARLRRLVRATDIVARIGGDRFAVLQCHVLRPSDSARLAHRVIMEVRKPVQIEKQEITVNASMGLALAPRDGSDARGLLAKAEADVLAIKARHRSRA